MFEVTAVALLLPFVVVVVAAILKVTHHLIAP